MSGIAGIIHFDGKPVEPALIEKMTSVMAHREPDTLGCICTDSAFWQECGEASQR